MSFNSLGSSFCPQNFKLFLAALMYMYRSGREETLKQFCGVIPGDRTTRGFLDPTDVSFNLQKCPQKKKILEHY